MTQSPSRGKAIHANWNIKHRPASPRELDLFLNACPTNRTQLHTLSNKLYPITHLPIFLLDSIAVGKFHTRKDFIKASQHILLAHLKLVHLSQNVYL